MASEIHASVEIDLAAKKYADGLSRMADVTKSQSARMTADLDATTKATDRLASGTNKAAQRMMVFGGVSHQLQDVAVQLQNGTKFATVFAQQGSQLASAFGPQGAILGGAIAIGAAIYTWATGAAKANKEFEEGEKRLKAMQAATSGLISGAKEDTKSGTLASVKNGDAQKLLALQLNYEEDIKKIREEGLKSGDKLATKIALQAREFRYEQEKAAAIRERDVRVFTESASKEKELESIRQQGRDADKERNEMNLTAAEKLLRINTAINSARNSAAAQPGFIPRSAQDREDQVRVQTKIKNLELEKAKITKGVMEDQSKFQGMQEKEFDRLDQFQNQRQQKFQAMQEKHLDNTEKREGIIQKRDEMSAQLGRKLEEDQIDQQAEVGQRINARAAEIGQSPAERSAARAAQRKEARSQQRAISEEIDKEDRRRRKMGASGLTQEEKEDMRNARRAGIQADKNKDVLKASINPDDITELARKIAEENQKLLAK